MGPLVDSHAHYFSRTFFETLAAASPLPGTPAERLETVTAQAGIEVPAADPEEHLARWIGELDSYGVGHLVTFASVPEEVPVVADAVRRAPDRLTGLAVFDPTHPEARERVTALLEEHGYRGVLLFPAMHGYRIDDEICRPALEVLDAHGAVAIVHCGQLRVALRDRFGLPRGYDLAAADPLHLVRAADRHRGARFVIPHFGAGFLRETLIAGSQCENVLVDSSSSNAWVATQPERLTLADVFERALGVFGPERILFGTDSSVFPRGWRHDVLLEQREALGACGLGEEDRARILGGNARALFGLQG